MRAADGAGPVQSRMALTSTLVSVGIFAMTTACIAHAYYHKQQFYPTVVYLTKSNASLAVLYVQALLFVMIVARVLKSVFFGQLRAAETEHLVERSWYAVTETCLAFTVFRDDFSTRFVAQFTFLLFVKAFHWLSEDRVDYMERSPVITILFHVRMMSLMGILTAIDSYFASHAYFTTLTKGASSQIVFGFEYAILITIVFHVAIKYILHTTDLRNAHPWEQKAVYLLYTELVIDFMRCMLYCAFIGVMIRLHTFPLYSIRPFYLTVKAFKKAIHDVIMSRRAIHAMNHLFPDVTQAELDAGDSVCIICREEMRATGASKRLPCTHMFHVNCLRSWFQRQQTCPTCRRDILSLASQRAAAAAAAAGGAPQQAPQGAQAPAQPPAGAQQQPPNQNQAAPPVAATWPPMPPNVFAQQYMQQQQQQQSTSTANTTLGSPIAPLPTSPPIMFNPMMMSPPMIGGHASFMMPPMPPAPINPALSDEEVRAMEGHERRAVEARIAFLRNMQVLLDCAAVQLQQYTSVLAALASTPEFRSPTTSTVAATAPAQAPLMTSTPLTNRQPAGTGDAQASESTAGGSPTKTSATMVESSSTSNLGTSADEVRRRRLEKFATGSTDSKE